MAYEYTGPSLAKGGRLVKKGQSPKTGDSIYTGDYDDLERAQIRAKENDHLPDGNPIFTPEEWAVRLAPGWDTRGWYGGGECTVRAKQKTRPSKGNTRSGRFAHPSLLRTTK